MPLSRVVLLITGLVARASAQDCGSYRSCGDCPAGCTWINRWDSTGWHCVDEDSIDKSQVEHIDFTDCNSCSGKRTCSDCNQGMCGWCNGPYANVCLTDDDDNKKICTHHGADYTGYVTHLQHRARLPRSRLCARTLARQVHGRLPLMPGAGVGPRRPWGQTTCLGGNCGAGGDQRGRQSMGPGSDMVRGCGYQQL